MNTRVTRVARAAVVNQAPPPPRSGRRRFAWVALAALASVLSVAAVASPAAGHPRHEDHHKQGEPPPPQEVIIVARKLANDQVEFGLRQREANTGPPPSNKVDIVISAERLANNELEVETVDGEIDFNVRDRSVGPTADAPWGTLQLPQRRFFDPPGLQFVSPEEVPAGPWLVSSELTLDVVNVKVRIAARRLVDGNIEIALQQLAADNSWGERKLPTVRQFAYSTDHGIWKTTSPIPIGWIAG